jgi:hypothetical protein
MNSRVHTFPTVTIVTTRPRKRPKPAQAATIKVKTFV